MEKKHAIAIITARGGSKRIPKKNIRDFCGKPIIAYSIEAAKASGVFDEIMVSTDSEEIAEIARAYGASVPFMRSDETSNDFATTTDVLMEVFSQYEERGEQYDLFCCMYPTAPFVTSELLCECEAYLKDEKYNTVIPVVRYSYPIQRAMHIVDGYGELREPDMLRARSQDLEPMYHDAGQFYWGRVDSFMEKQVLMGDNTKLHEVSELYVQDIDDETDWKLAELKYQLGVKKSDH